VRRQAAVDGKAIDPWHLAAVLEGLRLRMDGVLRIIDRGTILDAARHALDLHQWLTAPDGGTPLLAAAHGMRQWIGGDGHGGARAPIRAALIRFWTREKALRVPVPLIGARALRADMSWDASAQLRKPPSQLEVEDIGVPMILSFLDHIERDRGNTARSRNARLAAIRSFFRFLEYRVPVCLDQSLRAIPMKKTDEVLVASLSTPQVSP